MDTCSFPNCQRPAKARKLCQRHYMQWRRGAPIDAPTTKVHEHPLGHRHQRTDGYVEIKVGGRTSGGWPLEQRVIAEQMIGRPLAVDEQVHHINGIRNDNRPENLQVLTNAEHQRLHDHLNVMHEPALVTLACKHCGATYRRKPSRAATSTFCSNECRLVALHEGRRKPK